VTLLMRSQQALLHPHPMESNPAWAQTGVVILERIHFLRVRTQYHPAARLQQPLLVSIVWREVPNARRFQEQTCSVSCEDSKNTYIWYPDQDQSRVCSAPIVLPYPGHEGTFSQIQRVEFFQTTTNAYI
jgi:hypothetical protein